MATYRVIGAAATNQPCPDCGRKDVAVHLNAPIEVKALKTTLEAGQKKKPNLRLRCTACGWSKTEK